jgi:hypothetical protein
MWPTKLASQSTRFPCSQRGEHEPITALGFLWFIKNKLGSVFQEEKVRTFLQPTKGVARIVCVPISWAAANQVGSSLFSSFVIISLEIFL